MLSDRPTARLEISGPLPRKIGITVEVTDG